MEPDTVFQEIAKRRQAVLVSIDALGLANPPTLVAVSKQQLDARIDAMLATGQRVFGENKVQEAAARWQSRKSDYPDLELRLIGPLQSNKAADAVELFDVIETLDRPKLVGALARAMDKLDKRPQVLVQVNTGAEPQKAGVLVADLPALLAEAKGAGLSVSGLMCIPPVDEPAGPHFALLSKLADQHSLAVKSMGMSADYETATRFGSTHVRVGTALFGDR